MKETRRIKFNRYRFLAYLYFFFNSVGLKGGLLYTNLLTPFFYIWLLVKKKKPVLHQFFFFLVPFDIIHLIMGVDLKSFLVSNLLFLSTYIFVACFYYFINHYRQIGKIYRQLLITNFLFMLVAIVVYFTPYRDVLWYMNKFTHSVDGFYRLALLTFEASYYSLLFVPIAFYYLLKVFFRTNQAPPWVLLTMVILPLLLSLSLGVIGSMVLSAMVIYALEWKKVFYKKNFFNVLFVVTAAGLLVFVLLLVFYRDNPVFVRVLNIINGVDTSTKGRTSDSFTIAYMVAAEKSIWFGAGLGQVKVQAVEIVHKYFAYWGELQVVRIPNTVAETLAIFGITGLIIRFGLIFYLFVKTKVATNYYRLALFIFIFIYQFTGSYVTNIVEYVIWCIAFSNAFTSFDKKELG